LGLRFRVQDVGFYTRLGGLEHAPTSCTQFGCFRFCMVMTFRV
jgi:hypothetical protein